MGVNITTFVYLRVLIIQIGSIIILMVVEAQGTDCLGKCKSYCGTLHHPLTHQTNAVKASSVVSGRNEASAGGLRKDFGSRGSVGLTAGFKNLKGRVSIGEVAHDEKKIVLRIFSGRRYLSFMGHKFIL